MALLHTIFEEQVLKTPQSVAVIEHSSSGKRSIIYEELNRQANTLAHYINSLNFPTGSVIVVGLDRTLELIVAMLAVLKAGHAFAVIDTKLPRDRLEYMLNDSNTPLVITYSAVSSVFADCQSFSGELTLIDDFLTSHATEQKENLKVELQEDTAIAYIIYTSGSTGLPKGVIGTHAAMVNRCTFFWNNFPYTAKDVCCLKTVLTFIDFVSEVLTPLLQGVSVNIFDNDTIRNIDLLTEKLAEVKVTRIILVPSILRTMISIYGSLEAKLPSLKHWEVTGEAIGIELVKDFFASHPSASLYNMYGSSEVAGDLVFHRFTSRDLEDGIVPIGKPVDNVDLYLVDDDGKLADEGELYVSGKALARGYLGRPDLTAEKFVPNPYRSDASSQDFCFANMYKMGDWVRRRSDGTLLYLGRKDHQVKIRGNRVELLEIENTIAKFEAVETGVVKYWKLSETFGLLVAYLVLKKDKEYDQQALAKLIRSKLPVYMVPNNYVVLEKLPLNVNGKVDRLALPKPTLGGDLTEECEDELEEFLCETIAKEIGIEKVSPLELLDQLGISSLIMARIRSVVKRRYKGLKISLHDTLVSLKIRNLAQILREKLQNLGTEEQVEDDEEERETYRPDIKSILETFTVENGYHDETTGVKFVLMQESDLLPAAKAMARIFGEENAVMKRTGFTEDQMYDFFVHVFSNALGQELSVLAKLNDEIIGLDISFDMAHVYQVFQDAEKYLLKDGLLENHRPIFDIVGSAYIGTNFPSEPGIVIHQTYSAADIRYSNLSVGRIMNKISHKVAIDTGYTQAVTELTSMYSIHSANEDGFKFLCNINLDQYVDSTGKRPFAGLPGSLKLGHLKYSEYVPY